MCLWFGQEILNGNYWIKNVWFTDDAHFYLKLYGWCTLLKAPNEVNERPLHIDKCTAWCALSANGIIGPLCFQEQGESVAINQDSGTILKCNRYLSWVIATSRSAIWVSGFNRMAQHLTRQMWRWDTSMNCSVKMLIPRKVLSYGRHLLRTSVHLTSFCGDTVKTMCTVNRGN